MANIRLTLACVALLGGASCAEQQVQCGGQGAAPDASGTNSVTGTVQGYGFSQVSSAFWIGKPSAGADPVIFFLSEAPLQCTTISVPDWDKKLGRCQLLEMGISEAAARMFPTPGDSNQAYLRLDLNPSAGSGTINVATINPNKNIVGSFEGVYQTDKLRGTFDATYCATGVEP